MKTPQIFEQVAGGGGGGYGGSFYPGALDEQWAPQQSVPDAPLTPVQPYVPAPPPADAPWLDRWTWDAMKARKEAPLPTHLAPRAMSDIELAQAWKQGYGEDVLPIMQARHEARGGSTSMADLQHGMRLRVPPAGGQGAAGGAGGGAQGEAPFSGQKYMSVGGTPAKYSKADVAREQAFAGRRKGEVAGFAQARDTLTRDIIQQSVGWMQAAQNEQLAAGQEAGAAKVEYERASGSIRRNRAILDKMQIDPERYWKQMPASQQVLSRIALFFGGLAEGLSGGRVRNAAAVALQQAAQRDMEAQSANMRKLISTIDMDDRDRQAMWTRWQAGEARRRQAALAVMQLQVSRAGLMEKRLGLKEQYAGLVNSIDQHMLDVLRESRGRGGRKVPTPEYALDLQTRAKERLMKAAHGYKMEELGMRGKGAAGTRGDEGVQDAIQSIDIMQKSFNNGAWKSVGGINFSDAASDYEQKRGLLGLSLWRMFDSGKLSDADMKMAFSLFFPNAKVALIPGANEVASRQFGRLKSWLTRRAMASGTYKTPASVREAYKGAWSKLTGAPLDKMSVSQFTTE